MYIFSEANAQFVKVLGAYVAAIALFAVVLQLL